MGDGLPGLSGIILIDLGIFPNSNDSIPSPVYFRLAHGLLKLKG
jgi:hypothetical protein